jgi:hypothetical protein
MVERSGAAVTPAPAWPAPSHPKTADGTALAAAYCLPPDGSIDSIAGLPGPGAVLVPGTIAWHRSPSGAFVD